MIHNEASGRGGLGVVIWLRFQLPLPNRPNVHTDVSPELNNVIYGFRQINYKLIQRESILDFYIACWGVGRGCNMMQLATPAWECPLLPDGCRFL